MKLVLSMVMAMTIANSANAQGRNVLYEGLGMTLASRVDAMTDQETCSIVVEQGDGPLRFIIYPHLVLLTAENESRTLFVDDAHNLIRIDDETPISLSVDGDYLTSTDEKDMARIFRAILEGSRIRYRYAEGSSHDLHEGEVTFHNVSYVYGLAVDQCGWEDPGIGREMADVQLEIYNGDDGFAVVHLEANEDLELYRGMNEWGGGCYFELGVLDTFGMKNGAWVSEGFDYSGSRRLVIKDAMGRQVFSGQQPTETPRGYLTEGIPWDLAESAARAAWNSAPEGTIILEGSEYSKPVSLYGFREMWLWGVSNCDFPPLE